MAKKRNGIYEKIYLYSVKRKIMSMHILNEEINRKRKSNRCYRKSKHNTMKKSYSVRIKNKNILKLR